MKYPAAKGDIVSKVKGVKADDKKWFADTLPDKTYTSADDVFSALGWESHAGCAGREVSEVTGASSAGRGCRPRARRGHAGGGRAE